MQKQHRTIKLPSGRVVSFDRQSAPGWICAQIARPNAAFAVPRPKMRVRQIWRQTVS